MTEPIYTFTRGFCFFFCMNIITVALTYFIDVWLGLMVSAAIGGVVLVIRDRLIERYRDRICHFTIRFAADWKHMFAATPSKP